jgi:hypothetical protein
MEESPFQTLGSVPLMNLYLDSIYEPVNLFITLLTRWPHPCISANLNINLV